jgi:hypothetical protein
MAAREAEEKESPVWPGLFGLSAEDEEEMRTWLDGAPAPAEAQQGAPVQEEWVQSAENMREFTELCAAFCRGLALKRSPDEMAREIAEFAKRTVDDAVDDISKINARISALSAQCDRSNEITPEAIRDFRALDIVRGRIYSGALAQAQFVSSGGDADLARVMHSRLAQAMFADPGLTPLACAAMQQQTSELRRTGSGEGEDEERPPSPGDP